MGRQARWFFDQAMTGVAPPPEVLSAHLQQGARLLVPPLDIDAGWVIFQGTVVGGGLGTVTSRSETGLEVGAVDDRGRSWTYRFGVDPATGLINELRLDRVQHQEVTVRFATEADGPALAEIERRSPMVMGEVTVTIDRGGDYFAAARLMGDVVVVVAEIDGEPAAAHCAAAHTVHVGGRPYRFGYFHHLRILPEHQGKGLFGRMAEKMGERYYPPHVDGSYAYVSADNAASQRLFSMSTAWPVQPLRCTLDVAGHRGPAAGRPATPEDTRDLIEVLNTCHRDEELWVSYTVESLTARLTRAPGQYTWGDVWLTDGAVLGVWAAGNSISTTVEDSSGRRVEREGLVLDHGFAPGHELAFLELLRAWCSHLDEQGITQLVIFSSPSSPTYPLLQSLGARMDPFDLYLSGAPTPDDAAERGVYVDHIYF